MTNNNVAILEVYDVLHTQLNERYIIFEDEYHKIKKCPSCGAKLYKGRTQRCRSCSIKQIQKKYGPKK